MPVTCYTAFAPRTVGGGVPRTYGRYALKVYTIAYPPHAFDPSRFAGVDSVVNAALPSGAPEDAGRPHVGFVIQHQGLTGDYLVLAWWDRENELPLRVWVRDHGSWRPARESESICVWDLEIIWFERNLWIETALSGRPLAEALPEYVSRRFHQS